MVLTGRVESMTRAPWVLLKPSRAFPAGDLTPGSTTLGWRLVNLRMPVEWTVSLGGANELLGERCSIARERHDDFAAWSRQLADACWTTGSYDSLVVPVDGVDLPRDESLRAGSAAAHLAGLKSSFREDGTITASNASPLNDGPSVLLGSEAAGPRIGRDPIARIVGAKGPRSTRRSWATRRSRPLTGRSHPNGITRAGVSAVELNEAFAAQSLACVDAWATDPEIVNAKSGPIAISHPLGACGGRLIGTLAARLQETGHRYGVAAICIGQAFAWFWRTSP